jgi:ABC-type Fe3+-hydroxamate transport system substrate-binding protein
MALSNKTVESTSASATNTTTVTAAIDVPDNCHTVVITNPDATNTVYFAEGVADAGSALSATSSSQILPTKSFNLTIGTKSVRPSGALTLVYSTSAGSFNVNISYICTNIV